MAELVLHPIHLEELARQWLLEDTSNYDYSGALAGDKNAVFEIFYKTESGILAGIPFANAVFRILNLLPTWFYKDGDHISGPQKIAEVSGSAKHLLLAERVILNVLSRASGIATAANELKMKLKFQNWNGCLAGSRKTTPGFRMVEKYSLIVAGVDTHRYDLSSMVMLKDNHVEIYGSIAKAVQKARSLCGFSQKIEVECGSLKQAMEAGEAACDIIMLDNFNPQDLHMTAEKVKNAYPNILIEASGGIKDSNVLSYASNFVDIISSSSLVQGYKSVDLSMKVFIY